MEESKKYVCDFAGCGKSFKRADYLERHKANRKSVQAAIKRAGSNNDKPQDTEVLTLHASVDAERPRFECEHCKRGFARADVLAKHVGRAHASREDTDTTPSREHSEESAQPASKRPRLEDTSDSYATSNPLTQPAQAQWVQLRDIQSQQNGAPPAGSSATTTPIRPQNGFGGIGTPSANLDFSGSSYHTDNLFSLNALASVASGPASSTNGNGNVNIGQTSNGQLPGYDLPDIANQGLDENISPAGTNDSNFEHTFAWLFGNTSDATSFTAPIDNFSSILFAQPQADPIPSFASTTFTNHVVPSQSSTSVFQPLQQTPHHPPVASTSTLKPAYEPVFINSGPPIVYPIDNGSSVSFVNGETLDEPKSLIDNARRVEMLNIINNSADREAFDKCFTCKKLNSMVELYFIGFDPFYPVLHRPTMPYRQSSPFLLLAVVFLGTAWAQDKDAFNLASRLHRHVRQSIFTVRSVIIYSINCIDLLTLLFRYWKTRLLAMCPCFKACYSSTPSEGCLPHRCNTIRRSFSTVQVL